MSMGAHTRVPRTRRDLRIPGRYFCRALRRAVVVRAVGHIHPAVVFARLDAIQFVATTRSELGGPDSAVFRIDRQAERITVAD